MDLSIPVSELMTPAPYTVGPDDTLTDVWTRMLNKGIHHVPVCEGEHVVGILSARDLAMALGAVDPDLLETGYVPPSDKTVTSLMTEDVVGVTMEAPLEQAVRLFAKGRFHALPVLSGTRLVGIITTTDFMRALLKE